MSGDLAPSQEWWSAEQIAEARLPGLPGTQQGINAFALRENWRATPGAIKRKPGRGGGFFYHWSVLPFNARLKLIEREAQNNEASPEENRDRGQAWAEYEVLNQKAKDTATDRLEALQKVEALHISGATHVVAVEAIAKEKGVSPRTVYNWIALVEGVAPEDRLAYLAPRPPKNRSKPEDRAQYRPFMDWLKSAFLRLERPTFAQSYRAAVAEAKRKGWAYPILKTAKRQVDAEVPRTVQVFQREGVSGLMRCFPPQIRDRSTLTALEAVNADCHKIDVFVEWPDGTINRPQIVAFQDLYSGKILSWRVDHDPNKVMVMAAFGEMVENWGIPKRCLFDNGREFANKWMTAGAPTRFRFKVREDDPIGVLPHLGIQMHWATPAHGQAKPIERAFKDLASDVAKDPRFAGAYVGNRPGAKPENYGSRAIKASTFLEVLEEGIAEHNARPGRRSATTNGRSFDQTFEESYATAPIRKATEDQRRLWLMGQAPAKLHKENGGLKLHGNVYHCDWMSQKAGSKVVARFDPEDLHSGVHIYATTGEYMGFAECQQKVGFFDLEGARSTARRRSQITKAQKKLAELHAPLSPEQLGADMNAGRKEIPALMEAKVVSPVFPKMAAPKPCLQDTNPKAREARDALVVSISDKLKPTPNAETQKEFKVARSADERFSQAQEILTRRDAGEPVGEQEAGWLDGYVNHDEFKSRAKVLAAFERGNAG